jgi:hypothetical protein
LDHAVRSRLIILFVTSQVSHCQNKSIDALLADTNKREREYKSILFSFFVAFLEWTGWGAHAPCIGNELSGGVTLMITIDR